MADPYKPLVWEATDRGPAPQWKYSTAARWWGPRIGLFNIREERNKPKRFNLSITGWPDKLRATPWKFYHLSHPVHIMFPFLRNYYMRKNQRGLHRPTPEFTNFVQNTAISFYKKALATIPPNVLAAARAHVKGRHTQTLAIPMLRVAWSAQNVGRDPCKAIDAFMVNPTVPQNMLAIAIRGWARHDFVNPLTSYVVGGSLKKTTAIRRLIARCLGRDIHIPHQSIPSSMRQLTWAQIHLLQKSQGKIQAANANLDGWDKIAFLRRLGSWIVLSKHMFIMSLDYQLHYGLDSQTTIIDIQRLITAIGRPCRQVPVERLQPFTYRLEAILAAPKGKHQALNILHDDLVDLNQETQVEGQLRTAEPLYDTSIFPDMIKGPALDLIRLTKASKLAEEGRLMRHCVGAYAPNVTKGTSVIFRVMHEGKHKGTLELGIRTMQIGDKIAPTSWVLTQLYGPNNSRIPELSTQVVEDTVAKAFEPLNLTHRLPYY